MDGVAWLQQSGWYQTNFLNNLRSFIFDVQVQTQAHVSVACVSDCACGPIVEELCEFQFNSSYGEELL